MNTKEIEKTINELKTECAALVKVEEAARALVEFCYTTPNGKPGWRGEVNMHKGINIPASELRNRLAELDAIRRGSMKHKLYEPEGYEGCAACSVCRGAEASLPTDCPGTPMTAQQQDDVQFERVDYVDGHWRDLR